MQKILKLFFKAFLSFVLLQSSLYSSQINIDTIVKNSDKPVIVYLHRIGCSYCNSMQEFTLEDDEVTKYISVHYNFVNVNISLNDTLIYKGKESGGQCFAKNIGYEFYPSTLFLNKEADVTYATLGYKTEDEFLLILKFVKKNLIHKMSLEAYKKSVGFVADADADIKDMRKDAR